MVGFEPTAPFGAPHFKCGTLSHSDTLPFLLPYWNTLCRNRTLPTMPQWHGYIQYICVAYAFECVSIWRPVGDSNPLLPPWKGGDLTRSQTGHYFSKFLKIVLTNLHKPLYSVFCKCQELFSALYNYTLAGIELCQLSHKGQAINHYICVAYALVCMCITPYF